MEGEKNQVVVDKTSARMQDGISTPKRGLGTPEEDHCQISTPQDRRRKISFSYSAPTQRNRAVLKQESVATNSGSKVIGNTGKSPEASIFEDEESVLVASPFAYVTPPMPPREQVSNTKTTKAMAKIVEEEGTPDSVIRKLSFAQGSSLSLSTPEGRPVPGTVNRASKAKSPLDDGDDESFRFPTLSPDIDASRLDMENDSSSDGISRLSLSMVDLNPPQSPKPLRQGQSSKLDDSSTVPDMLSNCSICGKQFLSDRNLKDHYEFCRPDTRSRVGNSEASTLAQTTDTALALCSIPSVSSSFQHQSCEEVKVVKVYTESPELPGYLQRSLNNSQVPSPLPVVAPLPLVGSPSILASPTECVFRNSNDEEFLEEEISTFLECLRSDVRNVEVQESLLQGKCTPGGSGLQSMRWASRRAKIGRTKSEHSLCVSSEDDYDLDSSPVPLSQISSSKTGLVLAPAAPPLVPMSSNIYSPIPQRSSFDQETSMTTSFLAGGSMGPMGSPCSPIVATKLPTVAESLEALPDRTSPTFGLRMSLRSSVTPSVTDSSVTFAFKHPNESASLASAVRASERVACKCCGRKFATPSRLARHEAVCEQVFGRPKSSLSNVSTRDESSGESRASIIEDIHCKHCGRHFDHEDKLRHHEHVCLSVFKGRRPRSKSPSSRVRRKSPAAVSNSSLEKSHVSSVDEPGTAIRRTRCNSSSLCSKLTSFESISIEYQPNRDWRMQQFTCAIVLPPVVASHSRGPAKMTVGIQTVPVIEPVKREVSVLQRSCSSLNSETSSSMSVSRSSLEMQYHLLRDQIRNCSEKLKQRRHAPSVPYRDA